MSRFSFIVSCYGKLLFDNKSGSYKTAFILRTLSIRVLNKWNKTNSFYSELFTLYNRKQFNLVAYNTTKTKYLTKTNSK